MLFSKTSAETYLTVSLELILNAIMVDGELETQDKDIYMICGQLEQKSRVC